jgi:hypothetical protein
VLLRNFQVWDRSSTAHNRLFLKMTLSEFDSKPLLTDEDTVAVIRDNSFDDICAYVENGEDIRVTELLRGMWFSRDTLSGDQLLKAIILALFPRSAWMRWSAAAMALRLARATECEGIVRQRWSSLSPPDCHEFLLGLCGDVDLASWIYELPVLFELNPNNDVRAQIVILVKGIIVAKEMPEARKLLPVLARNWAVRRCYLPSGSKGSVRRRN